MSGYDLVVRGGRVVEAWGEADADVAVADGRVAAVGTGLRGRREIDAGGLLVLPGAVDGHVHMRTEREHDVYDDTWRTGTEAAAFGGVTAIVDQAQVEPGLTLGEGLRRRRAEAEGDAVVDYGIHVNVRDADPARAAEIAGVVAEGCPTIKLFMSYEGYQLPDEAILRCMEAAAAAGGMALVHAENGHVVAELLRRRAEAGADGPAGWDDVSPPALEGEAVHRALALARVAGCPLLVFHLTSAEAVDELARARRRGQRAYGEALLHHLLLDRSLYDDPERGTAFMGTPPLRGPADREALWAALGGRMLDVVSTDHGPRRRGPDGRVPPGTSGVEVRLSLVHTHGVVAGRISRPRWVELCCTAPARLHGLPGKGTLAPGADADIVLFDPEAEMDLTAAALHSAIDHATYEGMRAVGRPVLVLSRGEAIVEDGRLVAEPGRGRFLRRRLAA